MRGQPLTVFIHRLAKDCGEVDVGVIRRLPLRRLVDWMAFYGLEEDAYEAQRLQGSAKAVLESRPKLPVR